MREFYKGDIVKTNNNRYKVVRVYAKHMLAVRSVYPGKIYSVIYHDETRLIYRPTKNKIKRWMNILTGLLRA